jgi:flavin reductase (DIM6/NTAB) family NADH-FMN oxidoreductase RutF
MTDANLYKQVMRRYATGVMVLTVRAAQEDADDFHAVTVNSVTSVSLEPVLLLVCLEKNARSHELLHAAGTFALNILSAAQMELGKKFAYDRAARNTPRAHAPHCLSERGELLFSDTLGYLECRLIAEYPGGDHTIFLGEVLNAASSDTGADALVYYRGGWTKVTLT